MEVDALCTAGANASCWWAPRRTFRGKVGVEVVGAIGFDAPRPDGETGAFVMERRA